MGFLLCDHGLDFEIGLCENSIIYIYLYMTVIEFDTIFYTKFSIKVEIQFLKGQEAHSTLLSKERAAQSKRARIGLLSTID